MNLSHHTVVNPAPRSWRRSAEPAPCQAKVGREEASLTADLGEQLDSEALRACVDAEVERFCDGEAAVMNRAAGQPGRREMLGVLAFAYARRLFVSEEIARRCHTDVNFQQLCHGTTPFANELIRFRRHHRVQLEAVLANVLLRAAERTTPGALLSPAIALNRQLLRQAATRLNTARHMDICSE